MKALMLLLVFVAADDNFFVVSPVVLPTPAPKPAPVVIDKWVTEPVVKPTNPGAKAKVVQKVQVAPKQTMRAVSGVRIAGMYPAPRALTLGHLLDRNEAHAWVIPNNADLNSLTDSQLTRLHDLLHAGYRVKWYQQQRCAGRICVTYSYPILD